MKSILALLFVCFSLTSIWASAETVIVDFGADMGPATGRASGLLHSITATQPADSYVLPLKPKLLRCSEWSSCFDVYARMTAMGAKIQFILSDSTGYSYLPTASSANMTTWLDTVTRIVNRAKSEGKTYQWDIWNEPNDSTFWKGTKQKFWETWRQAYLKIRSLDPTASIVGPSAVGTAYVKEFLTYAKATNVLPDVVAWHHNPADTGRQIAAEVADMRAWMVTNGITITRISINETYYMYGNVGFNFASLEVAQVESVGNACYSADCTTPTLDGMVNNPHIWAAVKGYVDITGRLVTVTPGTTVDGVAGHNSTTRIARLVLSRKPTFSGSYDLRFTNMNAVSYLGSSVRVIVEGMKIYRSPHLILDTTVPVVNNEVQVVIPDFCIDAYGVNCTSSRVYKGYLVRLEPGAGAATVPIAPSNLVVR